MRYYLVLSILLVLTTIALLIILLWERVNDYFHTSNNYKILHVASSNYLYVDRKWENDYTGNWKAKDSWISIPSVFNTKLPTSSDRDIRYSRDLYAVRWKWQAKKRLNQLLALKYIPDGGDPNHPLVFDRAEFEIKKI